MGRPRSKPVEIDPEEESQDVPDEESARVIDEDELEEEPVANGGISKAQAVRNAMAEGLDKPGDIANFARKHYGLVIAKQQVSAYKSQAKNREKKQGGENPDAPALKVTAAPPVAKAVAQPAANGSTRAVPTSLFDDLKQLREMKDRYGDDFQKIVDAIG